MSVHNFCLKLFVITAVNHLHAYTIRSINYAKDNFEYYGGFHDATRKRHNRHQRSDLEEHISEDDDFDLRNEIKRILIHRIIASRVRDYNLGEETPEYRITRGRYQDHRRSGYDGNKPHIESGRVKESRRSGDALIDIIKSHRGRNSLKVNSNTINSGTDKFNSKWKPIIVNTDNTNFDNLDMNNLLEPEHYNIKYQRWKPLISDSGYDNSANIKINHLLKPENRGSMTRKPWNHVQVKPHTFIDTYNNNNILEPDDESVFTIVGWKPIRKNPHLNKINRTNLLGSKSEDIERKTRWKTISTGRDYSSDKIELNKLQQPDEDEMVFIEDTNEDSDPLLTEDDIQKIKLAIELEWRNVDQEEIITIFRSYWKKLIIMINRLNRKKYQEQKDYLLSLLETMKESVMNNPKYINIYLKHSPHIINEIPINKESDVATVDHPDELHETPTNELTIDMPPPRGLIRKICEGVHQNLEDFWKIFYGYFGKQPKDRANLQDLEKLYLILTIFTQFNKAKKLGWPIEKYMDQIVQIIEPDIHSLGPIFNISYEHAKSASNISCISCTGNKVKEIVDNLMQNEKTPEETVKIISETPNDIKYIPNVEDMWPVLDHKIVNKPIVQVYKPDPNRIKLEAKTVMPILDSNKLVGVTLKPLKTEKGIKHFKEKDLPAEKNIEDWENEVVINKNEGDTQFVKPVQDVNILHSDVENLLDIILPANKHIKPNLDSDKAEPKLDLGHVDIQTLKPLTDFEENEVKTINLIQNPLSLIRDLQVQSTESEKPIPELNSIEVKTEPLLDLNAITKKPVYNLNKTDENQLKLNPDRGDPLSKTLKPNSNLNEIKKNVVKTKPDSESKTVTPLQDILDIDVIESIPNLDDPSDDNLKSISDIANIIEGKTPVLNNLEAKKFKPIEDIDSIHQSPTQSTPDPNNLRIYTSKLISDSNKAEKVIGETLPDVYNLEAKTITPLEDLLNIDVIKPTKDLEDLPSETLKQSSATDNIRDIFMNTMPDLNKSDIEIISPVPDVDNKDTKLTGSIPYLNNKDKSISIKPDISNLNEISGNQSTYLNNLGQKPEKILSVMNNIQEESLEPTPIVKDQIINSIRDSDSTEVLPIRLVPHGLVNTMDKQIHNHETLNREEKIPYELDAERVETLEPIPHITIVETKTVKSFPDLTYEDTKDNNKIDSNLKSEILRLQKHDPNLSQKDIKNIILHGNPELNKKIEVQDYPQIISQYDFNFQELEKNPDIDKYLMKNANVSKQIQDEFVVETDTQILLNLPEIEKQIISKDIPRPSDKSNIKDNIPVKDPTYNYVTEKRLLQPTYDLVNAQHEYDTRNKTETQRQTSVELISDESSDLLTDMIIAYIKRFFRTLGLDILLSAIDFDMIIGSLVKILLIIFKKLTSNGVSLKIIIKLIMDVQDKLRLFQTPELQKCLHNIYAVVVDIIASIVKTIQN